MIRNASLLYVILADFSYNFRQNNYSISISINFLN